MITVTETASEKIKELLNQENKEGWGLRIAVQGGGCSGMEYNLGLAEKPEDGDDTIESQGVKLFVDPFSLPYVDGSMIDFYEGIEGQGFTVNNPNAVKSCGCGSSFGV